MPSYTVHLPRNHAPERAEEVIFVADRWSWPAFIFGPLWLIWHRLWWGLAGFVLLIVLLEMMVVLAELPVASMGALNFLLHVFIGLEGNQLRRWTLERNDQPAVAIVNASNLANAEIRYFTAATQAATAVPAPALPVVEERAGAPTFPAAASPQVIGLFPHQGGR